MLKVACSRLTAFSCRASNTQLVTNISTNLKLYKHISFKSMKQRSLHNFFVNKGSVGQSTALSTAKAEKSDLTNIKAEKALPSSVEPIGLTSPEKPKKLRRLRKATDKDMEPEGGEIPKGTKTKIEQNAGVSKENEEVETNALSTAHIITAVDKALTETVDDVSGPSSARSPKRKRVSPEKAAKASKSMAGDLEDSAAKAQNGPPGSNSDRLEADVPVNKKKAVLKFQAPSKVEGVGTGSLAAAALHADFDLDKLAPWPMGAPVPFAFLAAAFDAIGNDSRRLAKTQQLVNVFRAILTKSPEDLLPAIYLCVNQVAPAHEGVEMGIGDAILVKALAQATGSQDAKIREQYSKVGDLGTVAASLKKQRSVFQPKPLTLRAVFKTFLDIAKTEGAKSVDKKRNLINLLLSSSKDSELAFVTRALQSKLRIGLGAETVTVALAHAALLHRDAGQTAAPELANRLEQASQAVKQAYSQCPSFDQLIPALLNFPVEEVNQHVHFVAGVPIKPMLAKPTTGISEVLDKFQDSEFTCEYKYDGERAQIHITEDGAISIYSRNSENNTGKYPDLAQDLLKLLKNGVTSVVLDAEVVGYNRETGKILPFQDLAHRKRKGVKLADIKIRVCLFAFDCLYLNGETLLSKPLTDRRAALHSALVEKEGELQFAVAKTSNDIEELGVFLEESVAAGTEGLIVKSLDSTYEPSKRSAHWLKLKKDYLAGVGDTFDLVPIGAWHGRGKRKGVYGSFLLAIFNPVSEDFEAISKIGTGFSDVQLTSFFEALNGCKIPQPKPYYKYSETEVPDTWFDTQQVWEVKAADLSVSPKHLAALGLVDSNKGISIRFPRLVRVRDDKTPEQATTSEQIAEMYRMQAIQSSKEQQHQDEFD